MMYTNTTTPTINISTTKNGTTNEDSSSSSTSTSSSSSSSLLLTTNPASPNINGEFSIPEGVLSDLCSRFIINLPEEDRNDLIRVFFQIEIAHWFYLDFYCDDSIYSSSSGSSSSGSGTSSASSSSSSGSSTSQSSSDSDTDDACNLISRKQPPLKPCSIRQFAALIFRYCPYLMQHSNNVDDILSNWRLFKHAVPTNGAIILDASRKHVLLVQGFWAKASWGFPKGKVNENESESACARREVLEETGFDIDEPNGRMRDDQYLQIQMQDQTIRLYIVDGVSMKTKFEPRTRKEIKEVRWFPVDDLPVHRKDHRSKHRLGYSPNSFFMVIPFVKSLKQWIAIQNGTLPSAQLINGSIVHAKTPVNQTSLNAAPASSHHHHHHHHHTSSSSKHSTKKSNRTSTNTQQQSQSAGKTMSGGHMTSSTHRRRNSHSHSGGGGVNNVYNNNNYNYHHHQHHTNHSLNHYQQQVNDSPNRSVNQNNNNNNKTMSRSNENLSGKTPVSGSKKQQQQPQPQQQNVFLKHFSQGFSLKELEASFDASPVISNTTTTTTASNPVDSARAQAVRNQAQFYQKLQHNEIADLLSLKESSKLSKSTSNSGCGGAQFVGGQNSKFKPVINTTNNNNNSAIKVKNQFNQQQQHQKQQQQPQQPQQRRPASSTCKELQFSPLAPAPAVTTTTTTTFKSLIVKPNGAAANGATTTTSSTQSMSRSTSMLSSSDVLKKQQHQQQKHKQLNFNGPECWINFKFDLDSLTQCLPAPLIQL